MLKKSIIGLGPKKIVTVDPYSLSSYEYHENIISQGNIKKYDNKSFYNSYIQTKDVISSTVDIDNEVSSEDLKDAIEIKAYDELGLDSSREYSIFYFESNRADGDFKVFNVIAIDKNRLDEIFGELKDVKYIDYITVAPFLLKSLYSKKHLDEDSTDCFVYFHKDDAFVAIYQNGEYIFSKSIRYSLKNISDTFSKELGQRVDENEFFSMLAKSGLRNENSAYQQQLMKLFGEVFVYINDVILYAKRAYGLDTVNQIFMGTEIGDIQGIDEFCTNHVNIPTKKLEFKISKNAKEVDINPLHTLLVINAQEYQTSHDEKFNVSVFKRPAPLKDRPTGKLIQAVAASLVISLAYPAYQMYDDFIISRDIDKLTQIDGNLAVKVSSMKKSLTEVNKEKEKITKDLKAKNNDLDFRTKLLKEIYSKKVSYPMKAKVLTDLFERINTHNSKVVKVDNNSTNMVITVRSNKDKFVTELMKDISMTDGYDVSTELIKKDKNGTYYESAIKVGLHGNF